MSNRVSKVSSFLLLIICWATSSLSSHGADDKSVSYRGEIAIVCSEVVPCERETSERWDFPDEIVVQKQRSLTEPIPINLPPTPPLRKPSAPVGQGEVDTALQEKKVVLLIEDNIVLQKVVKRQFITHEDSGPFILKTAPSPEEGIKIFVKDQPRIIFVDYEFITKTGGENPETVTETKVNKMNGKEIILEIKRLYKTMYGRDFPGTFIAFSSQPEFNREMLLAGASYALPKALDIPLLNKVFRNVLNGVW